MAVRREVIGQPAQHRVGIPHPGGEILQRAAGRFAHAGGRVQHPHPLAVRVVLLVVRGVVLHGHRMEEERLGSIPLLVQRDDLRGHLVIGDEAALPVDPALFLGVLQVLQPDEFVDARCG